jgi:hypothetical protein
MTIVQSYMSKLRIMVVASFLAVSLGCGTWEDYRAASGAGKANEEAAIFKAHLENTYRIVRASDGSVEYQVDPDRTLALGLVAHPRVRLLPGQYTVTIKTWPFGSFHDVEVDLQAGHMYQVETYLCSFECISSGKPYRYDMWIQDFTTRERISDIVSECYLGEKRQRERQKVPCPPSEDPHDAGAAGKSGPEDPKDAAEDPDSRGAGKANPDGAEAKEDDHDAGSSDRPKPKAARGQEVAPEACGVRTENPDVAVFKAYVDSTRRISEAVSGHIAYQYNPERKPKRSDPATPIELQPGQYKITVKTRPFGSLVEFQVDLRAGHVYELQTYLCAFECISTGEPYRHDRWIQDLTTGKRISDIVSECYLGKKRGRERQKVACPDD